MLVAAAALTALSVAVATLIASRKVRTAKPVVVIYQLTAVATGANPEIKEGQRHALIVFLCAATREEADARLLAFLTEDAWRDWDIEQSGIAGEVAEKDERVRWA